MVAASWETMVKSCKTYAHTPVLLIGTLKFQISSVYNLTEAAGINSIM